MKNNKLSSILFLSLFLLSTISMSVTAQTNDNNTEDKIVYISKRSTRTPPKGVKFLPADKEPKIDSSIKNIYTYLRSNIKTNEINKDSLRGNLLSLYIDISENGQIEDVVFSNRIEQSVDKQAMDLLYSLPKYKPAIKDGKDIAYREYIDLYFLNIKRPEVIPALEGGLWSPEFITGSELMLRYIAGQLRYPQKAAQKKIEGRVVLRFTISESGEIVEIKTQKSVSPECDAEAIRVVSEMPNWLPALKDGKPISFEYTLPLVFRLKTNR